jgi:hypothetical protein
MDRISLFICYRIVSNILICYWYFTHEVFAGNTQDRTTLATMLDVLTARAGLTADKHPAR